MRFGILGDAKIAREKLLPAIRAAGHEVTHIGRRDASGGADPVWGDVAICSYEELLANPDVEAIYNPLPNHLHVPMAIRALEAGKPVLSEKPLALSLAELDAVEAATARSGLYLYDGYMVRYHPQWDWIRGIDVGQRKQLSAHFSYPPQPTGNIRNFADWGGGPIWDIGCYCLISGLMLFDGTPELVAVTKESEEALDVEKAATAIVDSGGGQVLHFTCSSGTSLCQSVQLVGTDGWARLDVVRAVRDPVQNRLHILPRGLHQPGRNRGGVLLALDVFLAIEYAAQSLAAYHEALVEDDGRGRRRRRRHGRCIWYIARPVRADPQARGRDVQKRLWRCDDIFRASTQSCSWAPGQPRVLRTPRRASAASGV